MFVVLIIFSISPSEVLQIEPVPLYKSRVKFSIRSEYFVWSQDTNCSTIQVDYAIIYINIYGKRRLITWISPKSVCLQKQVWRLQLLKYYRLLRFSYATRGSIKAAALGCPHDLCISLGWCTGILLALYMVFYIFFWALNHLFHYLSIILDYLVAYGAIGVCGYFKDSISGLITGSIVAIALRWIATVTSGAVVFASYAPQGQNPWIYSMIYNASYMVPDGLFKYCCFTIHLPRC